MDMYPADMYPAGGGEDVDDLQTFFVGDGLVGAV